MIVITISRKPSARKPNGERPGSVPGKRTKQPKHWNLTASGIGQIRQLWITEVSETIGP